MAKIYKDQGLYEKAIDSSLKSLSIMEKNFGKEDLKLVRHLSQLAGLYQEKGLYDKAILNLEKGIKLEKKFLGENASADAKKFAEKKINEKIRKGYLEI